MKRKNVLSSFNLLRQNSQKVQINSGIDILNHIWSIQKECGWEAPCTELQLCIERIIRGLGSPRSNSRKGFFVTFIGVCELFPSSVFSVKMCFDGIKKELQEFSSKAEENDLFKGQLLTYGGLIYSSKVLQANHEEIQTVLDQLIFLSTKKSYLKLATHTFFIDWLKKMDENVFEESVWNIVLNKIILEDKNNKSLQLFNLLFNIHERFPRFINEEFLISVLGVPRIFHKENLEYFVKSLIALPHTEIPVYQKMLIELVNSNEKLLKRLWLMIDGHLTSATSTVVERVLNLFNFIVQALHDKNWIRKMLTFNFVTILVSESKISSMEYIRLHTIETFSKVISNKNSLSHKTQMTILNKLLFYQGTIDFLNGHGEQIFQALVSDFDEITVKTIIKYFVAILNNKNIKIDREEADKGMLKKVWKEKQKKTACYKIIKLLNHPVVNSCIDWKVEHMKIFIDIAFFSKTASSQLSDVAKRCFYNALDFNFANLTDLCAFLNGLVLYLNSMLITSNFIAFDFGEEHNNAWKKMLNTVNAIANDKSNTDNEKLTNTVFNVMFLLLGLTIFGDYNSAIENLEELHAIYKKMLSDCTNKKKKLREGQEMHWTDVIIDLILSLLSYNNHFHKNVVCKVFSFLCPHLSSENIHQILSILNPSTENVLSAGVDKKEYEVDKKVDDDDEHELKNNVTSSDDETMSNSSNESNLEGKIDEKLRATLHEALGDAGAFTDTESINLDDMDEEEGKRLDLALSEAFKQMKNQKLGSQTAKHKQLSDFRTRVIDLLEIWAKTVPELNLIFDVMVTILILLENTLQNKTDLQLQIKLRSFINQLTSVKQFSTNEKLEIKQIGQLLNKLMAKDDKTTSIYINMSQQIIQCCKFILKISLRDLKKVKKIKPMVIEAYKNALYVFFHKNHSIIPIGLFGSALMMPWDGSFDLVEDILLFAFEPDIRHFHLSHAINLLQIFLRNKRLLDVDMLDRYTFCIRKIVKKIVENIDFLLQTSDKVCTGVIEICQRIKKLNVASDILNTIDINCFKNRQGYGKRKLNDSSLKNNEKKLKCFKDIENVVVKNNVTDSQQDSSIEYGNKRKTATYKNVLQIKKARKDSRSKIYSEGLFEGVFGNHLFHNSAYMSGEVQDIDSDGT